MIAVGVMGDGTIPITCVPVIVGTVDSDKAMSSNSKVGGDCIGCECLCRSCPLGPLNEI